MLCFVKHQQYLALAEIETQITQNPVAGAQPDYPAALCLDKPALAPISFGVCTLREAANDAH